MDIDSQIAALTIERQLSLIGPKGYLQRLQRLHALLTADPDDSGVGEEMLAHVR